MMIDWRKEVRRIAVELTVLEVLRLREKISKETFKLELEERIDKLLKLPEEVDNEKTNTV